MPWESGSQLSATSLHQRFKPACTSTRIMQASIPFKTTSAFSWYCAIDAAKLIAISFGGRSSKVEHQASTLGTSVRIRTSAPNLPLPRLRWWRPVWAWLNRRRDEVALSAISAPADEVSCADEQCKRCHPDRDPIVLHFYLLPSSIGQDGTLSQWRERFNSARERHFRRVRSVAGRRFLRPPTSVRFTHPLPNLPA